ncbi:glucose-6-phosphate isomerase [Galactobacter valiniphilus]|uniref:Glucose-6-phosphate isomerase n=1 Tax=Galactobacter valiniphilus TaxID=2676122 RepID=A0A399JAQ2_9MICC|nr:glucose-6-phosphate isomerase [Galactobacter valiniphilus]RII42130.1 glucose-6-phosphate isomerase [Galactobacter valiniphilus]
MTDFGIAVSSAASAVLDEQLPGLVEARIASRLAALDDTLWGPEAQPEASIRLGWVHPSAASRPLVEPILALRDELRAQGVDRVVLAGMGGSSLAPEVITRTAGVELTVLDSTDPTMVRRAVEDRIEATVLVVSSKSGSTLETDSQRRIFEQAFTDAGIDPAARIVVVTDPGSPLDASAREAGYRVFNADPNVGGRYSALTAFGLVPSGLAGADIIELLDDAEAAEEELAEDDEANPGLALGVALAGSAPARNKIVIVDEASGLVGFADWAEQLIAESTGKLGKGVLPVAAHPGDADAVGNFADVRLIRLVPDLDAPAGADSDAAVVDQLMLSGSLGTQFAIWEHATAVAGYLLGINPFDQPDVEAAKAAARGLLDATPAPEAPVAVDGAVELRASANIAGGVSDLATGLGALFGALGTDGYVAVQAYLDRIGLADLEEIRAELAAALQRPVTFGWGPRFLHSTGQFHKGGPAQGVFLQLSAADGEDLPIPGREFTFGGLIRAQADGDAQVLAEHGLPVLRLRLNDTAAGLAQLRAAVSALA